jgi:hypothetical protein
MNCPLMYNSHSDTTVHSRWEEVNVLRATLAQGITNKIL